MRKTLESTVQFLLGLDDNFLSSSENSNFFDIQTSIFMNNSRRIEVSTKLFSIFPSTLIAIRENLKFSAIYENTTDIKEQ